MRPSELLNHLMTNGVRSNGIVYTIPDAYGFKLINSYSDLNPKQYTTTNIVNVPIDSPMLDIAYACQQQGKVLYIDSVDAGQYQTPVMLAYTRERRTHWTLGPQAEEPDFALFKDIPIVSNHELEFIPPRNIDYLAGLTDIRLLAHQQYKSGVLNEASKYDIVVASQRAAKHLTINQTNGMIRAYVQPQ